jgi:class 3 adenylate cyclase
MLRVMVACSACGSANPEGFRFCGACAAPLAAPVPAHEERKTVTVLFADLAGFTARSDRADPEDVLALVRPFHEILRRETEVFGGTLARIVGDAGMLVFGYPQAHEEDPERAVRAGFAILDGLHRRNVERPGLDLHARIGINTAEAVVTYGSHLEDADDIMGDGVNVAARLQAAAPVDGIVVGEATYRATAGAFQWQSLPPIEAKGKSEPIPLWRPIAPLARFQGALQPETTPFVGRALELSTLVHVFERSCTTPSLEVVTVVADPGIGKSRLVREFARYVDALPDVVTWRVGRCLPYGDGISFWALGEIIAAHAGILETDDQVTLAAKLDAVLTEPDQAIRSWMRERLAPLVGLETSSHPPLQEEAFTAWRRFLESMARDRPTVLVIEDLHWADDAMVAFLQHLAASMVGLPMLIVVTARPEVEERHPSWLGRARRSTVLSLDALGDQDLASLIETTLPGASPALVGAVLDRAGGSPLYAEQLAAMLGDGQLPVGGGTLDRIAIPPSIQALLAARIDGLPRAVKPALLDASVVGKVFWSGAVATLGEREPASIEPALADLARRAFTRPSYPSSVEGEAEYVFWHALMRDVAYAALPRQARLQKHRAAAAWISQRAGGRGGRTAEIVVEHYTRALELATELGATAEVDNLRQRLVDALLGAAEHGMSTRPERAVSHLQTALALLDPADARRADLLARLGWALVDLDLIAARQALEAARELLIGRGDTLMAAEIAVPLSVALTNTAEGERASAILEEAREVLVARPGPTLLAVLAEEAMVEIRANRWERGARLAEEAISLAAELGLTPPPRALIARGHETDFRRAIDLALSAGDVHTASTSLYNLGISMPVAAASLAVLDEAVAFDEAHGLPAVLSRRGRASTLMYAGQWDGLADELSALRAYAAELGDSFDAAWAEAGLIELRLEQGEAVGSTAELEAAFDAIGLPRGSLKLLQGRIALAAGDREAARAHLEASVAYLGASEVATDLAGTVAACLEAGEPILARRASTVATAGAFLTTFDGAWEGAAADRAAARALVSEADGELAAARAGFEQALATWTEQGWLVPRAYVLMWLGRCLTAMGETDDGIARLDEARVFWASRGARPRVAETDRLLAAITPGTP